MENSKLNWLLRIAVYFLAIAAVPDVATSAVAEPRVERFDANHVIITWTASVPVDVYLSDQADADTRKSALLYEDNHDGRHMATVTEGRRSYFILRDRIDGSVVRVSERVLPLERGSNFRDVGGYEAANGKHVRWGLIYRSGATPLLSDHDIAYIRALGIGSMIDLRSTEERQLAPTRLTGPGIRYIAIDYSFNTLPPSYYDALTTLVPQYRAIFRELLLRKGPISYNCTAGQDRTGVATALILSALGVHRATILQDYHLSTKYRHPENEMPAIDPAKYPDNPVAPYWAKARQGKPWPLYSAAGRSMLAVMFDRIDARWGSVENYLQQMLGVGPGELALLRANYLE